MPRISESVIKEIEKVLKEQFNIKMRVLNGNFQFIDLEDNTLFAHEKPLVSKPDSGCIVNDVMYKSKKGKAIRCIEKSYGTGSGTLTILVADGKYVWRVNGDNYPRDNSPRTGKTPIDCDHIVLNYQGLRENYPDLYQSDLFIDDNPEYVEMIPNGGNAFNALSCDILLAKFYIFGTPIVYVTTEGVYIVYDGEVSTRLLKESDLFDAKTLKDLIKQRVRFSYEHRGWIDQEIIKRKIDFLVGRVDEFINYINAHRDEYLAQIDRMADVEVERKAAIVEIASQLITTATNTYNEQMALIKDKKAAFEKTFPKN